jgi:hypothetical protein
MRHLTILSASALLAAACGGPGGTMPADGGTRPPDASCKAAGDPTQPVEVELYQIGPSGERRPIAEGGALDIVTPPQGGIVAFVGARVRNMVTCGARISGAIRDVNGLVRVDSRSITLRVDAEGWAAAAPGDFSSVANVPLCHNTWSSRDLYDVPYELEITVQDGEGHTATRKLSVIPRCAETPADECRCICKQGYVLGQACDGAG